MNKFLTAAIFAASMVISSAVSASVITFNSTSVFPAGGAPIGPISISAGDFVLADVPALGSNDSIEFIFEAVGDIVISPISMTGNGFNGGADLATVKFGFSLPATDTWSAINGIGGVGNATGFLGPVPTTFSDGSQFSIFWQTGATDNVVGLRANFLVSAVPVPAALPLMVGGLAMLGFARRKSAKASAA